MEIKILTEGGSNVGSGHLSRCCSLYDEIEERKIPVKLVISGDVEDVNFLKGRNILKQEWASKEFVRNFINKSDYCIIDSYIATEKIYWDISEKSKKCLYIDDYCRIDYPKGIVVNPSFYVDNLEYKRNNKIQYLVGREFIILRKPFLNIEKRKINTTVKKVLVTFGGSDPRDLTSLIMLNLCKTHPEINFDVIVGNAFQNVSQINNIKLENVSIYYDVDAELMKDLMLESDLAITAAGQTIYELIATQTPFIPIKVIENQTNNIKGLIQINPDQTILNHDDQGFIKTLDQAFELLLEYSARLNFSDIYSNQIDGFGCKRIIDCLLKETIEKNDLFLRKAVIGDMTDIFILSNQDYVRRHSINKERISWEEHDRWFKKTITDPQSVFYIITNKSNNFLGQIRYMINNASAVVSISLCGDIIGKGFSRNLLLASIEKLFIEHDEINQIIAFVSEENIASRKLFIKSGFVYSGIENCLEKFIYSRGEVI